MYALLHSMPPALQQATADPCLCWSLLDTYQQVWVSFLWDHCSFLLGPGAHKVLFVPTKSLFPQACLSSGGSMVGLMATSSKRAYAMPVCCIQSPCPCSRPLMTRASSGNTQTQFYLSLCGAPGSCCPQVCLSLLSVSGGYGV